jgi:hypothetical protein
MEPIMRMSFLALAAVIPLSAQTWDARLDFPFPQGQNLPQTFIQSTGEWVHGNLDTGSGATLTLDHRILRINPILKFQWGLELSDWKAAGQVQEGQGTLGTRLEQSGVGVNVDAQFWIPFTGVAAEMGLIERFQAYKYEGGGASTSSNLARTWLRVGVRCRLPVPILRPYLAAGYQQPVNRQDPVQAHSIPDLETYFKAQGSGQEFQRLWTFGVGMEF